MKRLPIPGFTPDESYAACVSSIRDVASRVRMRAIARDIERQGEFFAAHAKAGVTYAIPSLVHQRGEDPLVVGNVRKSELVNLYKRNMVGNDSGREIYEAILVSATNCPSCGDVGVTRTLDHYLPKANYPALSVCPYNLMPACRDCNTDKGNPVPKSAFEQLINPYFDEDCFFNERWVYAVVNWTSSCEISFHAYPPIHWGRLNRERAIHHFEFYKIADIYSRKAAEEVPVILDQRQTLSLDSESFKEHLFSVGNSSKLFPNHWRKALYLGLASDQRFCL